MSVTAPRNASSEAAARSRPSASRNTATSSDSGAATSSKSPSAAGCRSSSALSRIYLSPAKRNTYQISGDGVENRLAEPAATRYFLFYCCRFFAHRAKNRQQKERLYRFAEGEHERSLRRWILLFEGYY